MYFVYIVYSVCIKYMYCLYRMPEEYAEEEAVEPTVDYEKSGNDLVATNKLGILLNSD